MFRRMLNIVTPLLGAVGAAALGLAFSLGVAAVSGESPWHVFSILLNGAFGSDYNIGMTLFYATPLVFTGLAVALPYHAGLFNIGAEGQLLMGALGATLAGVFLPDLPFPLAPIIAGIAAAVFGAIWGAIPGWIRAYRGGHEVISTIMLNFIAAALTSYIILDLLHGEQMASPESRAVSAGFILPPFPGFEGAPIGAAGPLAVVAVVFSYYWLRRSSLGFQTTAVGESESAAALSGINPKATRVRILALGGAMAGLVGVVEVLGNSGRFKLGFSPDYGFTGIAVALLARCHPLGVIPSALLFGALHKGSADLDLETSHVTRDLALVMQACIIAFVTVQGLWNRLGSKWLKGRHPLKSTGDIHSPDQGVTQI